MRFSYLLLFTALLANQLLSQTAYLDSMRLVFQNEKDPGKKVDAFYEIANDRSFGNPDLAFAYADSLEQMAKQFQHKKALAMCYHIRGFGHDYLGEHEKAMELFEKELAIFESLGDRKEMSTVYTNIGSVWESLGHVDSSVAYYLRALAIDEERGDSLGMSIIYNNIGNTYSDEGVYDRAIEYFEKALAIRQQMGAEKRYTQCYSNLASVYGRKLDFQKAEEYAQKGLELAIKYDNKNLAAIIANNLGSSYNDLDRYEEAIPWLEQALANWQAIGYEAYQTYAYYNLSTAYAGIGNGTRSLQYAKEGFAIVEKLELNHQFELYYKAFARAYEAKGDIALSYDWYKKFITLADSIFKLDNTEKVAQMEARYETQKKEAQIAQQELELERRTSQKNRILVAALIAFLLLLGLFQYLRSKEKIRKREAELSAKLERAEAEKLREINALKSTFFANISHEFRTPLTLIISPLKRILDNPAEKPNPSLFRTMLLSGERLLELVNQMLDLAKAEAGQLELKLTEKDVLPVLRGIAASFTSLADVRQIHFEMATPASVLNAKFDHDKLVKILSNLLSNAFKFTQEEGWVKMEASIDQARPQVLTIAIRDNGIGISETELPRLFERFYQSKESQYTAGTGIGLALTKELVELHGGFIRVDSPDPMSNGTGTVFTIELPILLEGLQHVQGETVHELVSTSTISDLDQHSLKNLAGKTSSDKPVLLVVEDNPDVQFFIKDCLEKDFQIALAPDGATGLQAAQETIPDLIISDVMMPRMDGFELCHALKTDARTSHIPVVLLTARAEQHDKLEGLQTGADDYLVKPFDAKELHIRVSNLIAQRKQLQEHLRATLSPFASEKVEAESMDVIFLKNVKSAIESNLEDEKFSVSVLSKNIGMSRSQLHRKMTALTGYSPNEVIRNMRLEKAKMLLEQKSATVSEVAYLCGFSSPAYFIKCFKDYFGKTPGEV